MRSKIKKYIPITIVIILAFLSFLIDKQVVLKLTSFQQSYLDPLINLLTSITLGFIILLIVSLIAIYKKNLSKVVMLLWSSTLVSLILSTTFKFIFKRPRPFDILQITPTIKETTFSFPSNHATVIFAIASVFAYQFPKYKYTFFTIAIIFSVLRIYQGVHYPSDILFGALLGYFTFKGILLITKTHLSKRGA